MLVRDPHDNVPTLRRVSTKLEREVVTGQIRTPMEWQGKVDCRGRWKQQPIEVPGWCTWLIVVGVLMVGWVVL